MTLVSRISANILANKLFLTAGFTNTIPLGVTDVSVKDLEIN